MTRLQWFSMACRLLPERLRLFIVLTLLCAPVAGAEKTDIIELFNGDRITCEIKRLERGRLQVNTDSLGTIYIEWKDIVRVTSKEFYIVELFDGTKLEGLLVRPDAERQLLVLKGGEESSIDMSNVVWIDLLKLDDNRIEHWDGSITAGFDTTKANNDTSLSASINARRRAETYLLSFDGSIYSRSQNNSENSLRAAASAVYRGYLEDRWYWSALGGFESNDELGIDLRTNLGGGYGRYLVQNNHTLWSLTVGLLAVNEQSAGSEDSGNNIEGLLNTEYEFFTYDSPKTSFVTSISLFPVLTDWGRWRSNLDLALRRELISDLFFEVSFYGSYDNEPPVEGEMGDYGIVTSLGYTF